MFALEAPAPARKTLRPYQLEALEAVADAVDRGVFRFLIVAATGAGKTVILSRAADVLRLSASERVLILAHRDELVEQAVEKYLADNPDVMVGVEKASRRASPMDHVVVASVQTLQGKRLEEFRQRWGTPALVITDEAHHAAADSYRAVYDALGIAKDGPIVHLGVTATPKRGDGQGLDKVFDEIVYAVGIEDLIGQGWLVDVRGFVVQTRTSLDAVKKKAGDFNDAQLAEAVNTPERNAQVVKAYLDLAAPQQRPTVVYAVDIQHTKDLCEHFRAAGVRADWVAGQGSMRLEDRRRVLASFGAGEIDVIVNCDVLTEGWDEPKVRCVMLARPAAKPGPYVQRVGRGTRLHPDCAARFVGAYATKAAARQRREMIAASPKPDCLVIDVVDVSRKTPLVTLPTLLGMPAGFDLKGRSVTKAAKKYDDVLGDSGTVGALVLDGEMLDALAQQKPDERLRTLIAKIRETTQEYVPVDLLKPKPLPEWAQNCVEFEWFSQSETTFRLNLPKESVLVEKTLLGTYDVRVQGRARHFPLPGGPFRTLLDAMKTAEGWVREARSRMVPLKFLDAKAEWRQKPATAKQKKMLQRVGVKVPRGAKAGDVSPVIAQLRGEGANA